MIHVTIKYWKTLNDCEFYKKNDLVNALSFILYYFFHSFIYYTVLIQNDFINYTVWFKYDDVLDLSEIYWPYFIVVGDILPALFDISLMSVCGECFSATLRALRYFFWWMGKNISRRKLGVSASLVCLNHSVAVSLFTPLIQKLIFVALRVYLI